MSNPLVKRAYDIEYEMFEKSPSFSSWTMSLKSLLYNMGLNFAWDNQNIVNHNAYLHLCKQMLQNLYLTKWNAALSASSDGLIYKSYKVMPCYSNYFNKIVIPKHRYAFVKFVTKNHRLPVVSGKWHRPRPYNQRMCEVCGVLGDEYHFLLVCKSLSDLRQRYIPEYYFKYPSMYTFIALMSTDYVKTIRHLAAFVYSSLQRTTL